jgi:hypothetical protein
LTLPVLAISMNTLTKRKRKTTKTMKTTKITKTTIIAITARTNASIITMIKTIRKKRELSKMLRYNALKLFSKAFLFIKPQIM